ncbi:uncharacterized protein MKZ38_002958 [Zalerion maritima]|uniref:beta-glucosidase n=1 Tax=Zalerion maritima TaxID=339359 RepID=A0AAD5WS11_9PEZI|nr:uncharacterized protein MKZ38_002958 [Zalerion maritima]
MKHILPTITALWALLLQHSNSLQIQRRDDLSYSEPSYPSPWMDPEADGWQDAYAKAKDFVSQLTLLEKVNLTTGVGWMSERCVGNAGSIPRLGMRGLCMQDGPLGIRISDYNSVFPSGMTAAATWDRGLMYRRGKAIGDESKGKGINVLLGPAAGPLGRLPAGGRNWEGFSPDPWLSGVGFAETIMGVQDAGVIATAKHWVGNEQEHFRQAGEAQGYGYDIDESMSSNIDDKTMHELYMWPFQDAVRAGVGAVMCAYTQVNNSYSCQNSKIMNGLLKHELGFQGFVMSDWQAQHAGAATAVAGLDMTMPGDTSFNTGVSYWGANLTLAVLNGTVPEYRVDDMAMRIMAAFFKVGQEVEQPDINFSSWTRDTIGPVHAVAEKDIKQVNFQVDVRDNHGDLIREIAARATVLLKNEGALPLKKPKLLAVIGEDAGPNPDGPNGCSDRGCNQGTLALGWGSGTSNLPYLVTPDMALQQRALQDGSRYESIFDNWGAADQIQTLVSQEDATSIVFVNADAGEGFINVDDNMGDRKNLTLWNNGDILIKKVSAICPNTIVVIHSVGPVLIDDYKNNPNITAIVWAALPGQESGNSLVDVLYGRVNPAGRTPFTWGKTREDYGVHLLEEANNGNGAPQDTFSEGVYIDYRHFDSKNITPTYEFGYGLSYTTFEYSNIKVRKTHAGAYVAAEGETMEAPTFGDSEGEGGDLADYQYADNIDPVTLFIYPYLNGTTGEEASGDPYYGMNPEDFLPEGATDSSAQPLHPAGGQPGGNPGLWDVMYVVSATIKNTGDLVGDEVPQLYVSLGGTDDPPKVLRGFDRIRIDPGHSAVFRADITRRDLSNWDVVSQNWVISDCTKKVYIGSSSRNIQLEAKLK